MNAVVDIGNSYYKLGLFAGDKLIDRKVFNSQNDLILELESLTFKKSIVCSVSDNDTSIFENGNWLIFSADTKIPIKNDYQTPLTLGLDRLAAAIGASVLYSQSNVLIIDAGSCITYDFLTSDKCYKGGAISPGINMKFKALNNFTSKLPLIELSNYEDLVGVSTETSILSGVLNGTIAEISGIIQKYQNISDNLAPILCGGDARFISKRLEMKVEIEENLVLYGLNEVLKVNE